jgi:hypothetical protein
MSRIFAKSPYIIEINEASQIGAKVEIYLKKPQNGVVVYPTLPSYTLSKLIASSNAPTCYFDISEYIQNFLNTLSYTVNTTTEPNFMSEQSFCFARIKRYKLIGSTYTLIDTVNYTCFNGYVYNTEGINIDLGAYLLPEGTYYYNKDLNPGDLSVDNVSGYKYKYTDLVTGTNRTYTSVDSRVLQPFRVFSSYLANGNKLEILNASNTVLKTYYFKPIEANKYGSVTIDFVNKYGAFQREFFLGASVDSMNVSNSEYKSYRANETTFNSQENLVQTFNINGTESIKVNSGWVDESFKETIKQLLLSDRILVNNRPAKLNTKQIDLQKNINNKMINYPLEFNFTNDII